MNEEIEWELDILAREINRALDRPHDELLSELRRMARSTGQRTRVDRL